MTTLKTKYSFIFMLNFMFQNAIKSLRGNSQIPKKPLILFFLDRKKAHFHSKYLIFKL
jgi:hypothetical protein